MVGVGSLGGGNHFFVGSIQTAIADVLHDGALEQPGVLQHHAEALAQSAAVKVAVEYSGKGNKFVEVIRLTTETLSGIPSIVYGLFGMLFFVNTLMLIKRQ